MAETSIVTAEEGRASLVLPDLSKPGNMVKFAAMWSDGKIARATPEQQMYFLAAVGNYIGVKVELGEIMLYQGKPYITIDGRIRVAHASGLLDGIDVGPASQMEYLRYGCQDGEFLWKCLVWKKGARKPFVGWGHVGKGDKNPVSKTHPRELAKKRAKYDALRLAFPPKEEITEMHEKYIDEAEQLATQASRSVDALVGAEEPDDETVAADEIAADFTVDPVGPTTPEPAPCPAASKKMPFGKTKGVVLGEHTDDQLIATIQWCEEKDSGKFGDLIFACRAVLASRDGSADNA